ncbi:MAG: 5'-methylthioadenosine/adenosylhomocysteine nucleosidase [Capnocytophaga sp.]|nr:5'-methylthioadenosine/adenosylhomocysteine nucleosidase [Capnocytophaga sp.]
MKIGIIGAMDIEIQLLREHLKDAKETKISRFSFYEGKIGNHQVVILLSGIGKVSASVGTALLIHTFSPDLVINTGTAGGLQTSRVYDLILATEVAYYDVDVTAFGYQLGQQAQMPVSYITDNQWLEKAKQNCLQFTNQLHCAPIVSGDSFIHNPEKKLWIEQNFPSALAVEMEAAAIAQTCYLLQTPFLVLRAISDNAGEGDTVSYDTFVEKAGELSAKMNINLIKSL